MGELGSDPNFPPIFHGVTVNKLLIKKLTKSNTLKFEADRKEVSDLAQQGFYTEAFLRMWRIVEVVSRELMLIYRASTETNKLKKKLLKALEKSKIKSEKNNLSIQFENILYRSIKTRMESNRNNIDVQCVKNALSDCVIDFDEKKVNFLLASKLNSEDDENSSEKKTKMIPDGIDNISIREKRNRLIHQNKSITADEYGKYRIFFNYFFSLILQIYKTAPENDQV